ncbi:hypothetical protein HU200_029046 [Digitaria exilis]|uniref:F-box domain-containing protein n=1 Tax=Digitaria exilis TaxID=1010633 RepID=A0A835BUN4_9POAL|nr:hypothetical protein HU200_029046 [Digitaria exilis]CAB3456824.1 unnamed protein product [Digitaria exilis]
MGKGTWRHKAKNKRRYEPPAQPTSVHDLPDDLLVRVLLGLGSPLHLVRAAATCRRWRRAVADTGFLTQFISLHGAPSVAGHYYVTETLPPNSTDQRRRVPEMTTATFVPVSAAVVDVAHFSLDFFYVPPANDGDRPRNMFQSASRRVRHSRSREIIDSRGSLLLLSNRPCSEGRYWSPDFIVCEPLTRRCQGIARPATLSFHGFLGGFLLDGNGGDHCDGAMSNFRVLSVLYEQDGSSGAPRACVFTPGSDGGWQLCWYPMDDCGGGDDDIELPTIDKIHLAGRAAGMIYWGVETGTVLVLDESTLIFSLLTFPEHMRWPYRATNFRVIGGGDDGVPVRIVRLDGQELEVYGQVSGSAGQWVVEKRVRLRDAAAILPGWRDSFSAQPASIVTAGDTFVVLTRTEKRWLFTVDLETMEAERQHERNRHVGPAYPCTLPWPPVLRAGLHHDDTVGKRRQRRNS